MTCSCHLLPSSCSESFDCFAVEVLAECSDCRRGLGGKTGRPVGHGGEDFVFFDCGIDEAQFDAGRSVKALTEDSEAMQCGLGELGGDERRKSAPAWPEVHTDLPRCPLDRVQTHQKMPGADLPIAVVASAAAPKPYTVTNTSRSQAPRVMPAALSTAGLIPTARHAAWETPVRSP